MQAQTDRLVFDKRKRGIDLDRDANKLLDVIL